ncbi:MAG: hypothetical protein AABX01_00245 [Candidatus Micrarchaeota archaeon]
MKFKTLNATANGNLLLTSKEAKPVGRKMQLFLNGKFVGDIFDTIGRVDRPFYLAKPKGDPKLLVGKELEGK